MIGFLSGTIHAIHDNIITLNVQGVGYEVHVPKSTLHKYTETNQQAEFEIHTQMSENSLSLFGFSSIKEKQVFQKLISVSGIGPKLGLTIISDLPLARLFTAITQGHIAELTQISGIGKKTAERIIIELRDKFKDEAILENSSAANDNPIQDSRMLDATSALVSLGYAEFQAKKIVNGLSLDDRDTVQSLIKKSLVYLQKN